MCGKLICPLSLAWGLGLLLTAPVGAVVVKTSNFGNAHQIWFEAEAYDARDPDTDAYFKVVDQAGAFGKAVTRTGGAGGMLRYTFDLAQAGGKGGTWYFWGRVIVPQNESDFLVVEGIPGEPVLPASPPYPGTSSAPGFTNAQRIFDEDLGPSWTWGRSSHGDGHTRQLKDGKNTMYILHRQGTSANFWDVFMWTDSASYRPTDDDYRNAKAVLVGGALSPRPAAGATDVPRDTVLSWAAGPFAGRHDVYLGTDLAAVTAATTTDASGVYRGRVDPNTYATPLAFGQTYYWRVDEVNKTPDNAIFKGPVWSFTVEPYAYPITKITATASSFRAGMEPEKTIDGSGLNSADQHGTEPSTMWLSAGTLPNWIQYQFDKVYKLYEMKVWNSNQLIESFMGFGAKSVKIEYSLDGTTWSELPGVPEFARAPGLPTYASNTTVHFGGVSAQYVKLTVNTPWGLAPQTGLSEVRFFSAPVQARTPEPANNATGVSIDATLKWRPGREAASHKVYLGTDKQAVTDGAAAAKTVTDHYYSPASLQLAATYYWRVDEVNEAAATKSWTGEVWSFTTQEYGVVDDFERYTDKAGAEIFTAWVDGFDNPANNGAVVGLANAKNGTFGDTTTFHGGRQSMPLTYDNTKAPFSEAIRTFAAPQNWTASGIKSLSLYFQRAAGNSGQLYLKINNTKVPYNGNAGDVAKPAWIPWNIDLSTVGGSVSNVTKLTIGIEGPGAKGIVYLDDIRLYPKSPEYITPADPGKTNLVALYAFEGNANDTSGHNLNGTLKQAQLVNSGRAGGGSAVKVEKVGYVDLGNPPALDFGTGDWSVAAWYKTAMTGTGDASKGTLYGKGGDTAGGHRYALIMSETAEGMVTLVTDDDVTKYVLDSKSKTNDDQWHFVVGQREGTTLRIYIDGQLEGSLTIPAAYSLAGTSQHNAYVGAITDHTNATLYKLYSGLIDDVRIYNKALSSGEVLWLMGNTTPVAKPF